METNTELCSGNLKDQLARGRQVFWAWNQTGSAYASEIFARAGFDGVIMDLEHGPFSLEALLRHVQAVNIWRKAPLVRVPELNPSLIKRILDTGIYGILVPQVETAEQAALAAASIKYPPEGIRGASVSTRATGFTQNTEAYFRNANREIFVAAAIENVKAVENLPEILAVDGLDAVFIGPLDLACSMGFLHEPKHPDVLACIRKIEEQVFRSNKYLGSVAPDEAVLRERTARGYHFLTVLSDLAVLSRESRKTVDLIRGL